MGIAASMTIPRGGSVPEVRQHSILESVVLHLLPGIPAVFAYGVAAAQLHQMDLPHIFALLIAIAAVEVPVTWGLMAYLETRETGAVHWKRLFPWRERLRLREYVLLGVPLIFYSFLMVGAVSPLFQNVLVPTVFSWVPEWFVMQFRPDMFSRLPHAALVLMWSWGLVTMTLVGGFTQELYFRGYLLPRMAGMGAAGPVLNALLFAVFHMAAPWSWPVFFVMVLPWSYLVYRKRSVQLGLFIHVGMLLLQSLMMSLLVFGVVRLPAGGP